MNSIVEFKFNITILNVGMFPNVSNTCEEIVFGSKVFYDYDLCSASVTNMMQSLSDLVDAKCFFRVELNPKHSSKEIESDLEWSDSEIMKCYLISDIEDIEPHAVATIYAFNVQSFSNKFN